MMKIIWERVGAPTLAAVLALIATGPTPWWWDKLFQPPIEKKISDLWSCGWGDAQDKEMGVQCPQADPLHFNLIAAKNETDKEYCTSIDLANEIRKGESLVEEPVQIKYMGSRPGSKYEGHRPEFITGVAVGKKIVICGYYSASTSWQNTDTYYELTYRIDAGNQ